MCQYLFVQATKKAGFLNGSFMWDFIEELEVPRVIGTNVSHFNTRENLFAQVFVRIRLKQVPFPRM